jgi:hypothetical protein
MIRGRVVRENGSGKYDPPSMGGCGIETLLSSETHKLPHEILMISFALTTHFSIAATSDIPSPQSTGIG